jgi:hypothetical protein
LSCRQRCPPRLFWQRPCSRRTCRGPDYAGEHVS